MTEQDYLKRRMQSLLRNLRRNKTACPEFWDSCDEDWLDVLTRVYTFAFEGGRNHERANSET